MDEHSVTTKMLKSEFILDKSYAAARTLRMPQIFSGILAPQWTTLMLPEPWRSGGPQEIELVALASTRGRRSRSRRYGTTSMKTWFLMDQEAEQEENVRQEAISDELGLEAENVAAGEKRLAEALDDSDESDIDESDIDTFLKDY
ncbi:hypothetical protein KUCAC02_030193 [Chaenocephalus aceratus]|uniref:Uncharacterized protein n=1 Tax=Chaenocephalus aceratus TaxID=36190 RepID=A0ACB9XKE4_CHAAC|nr:hypothetical protein KUCAC02_030193 [Chaenocephalus aceratus]